MKILKYSLLQGRNEDDKPILLAASMEWSEDNEKIAKIEAYEGKYTIEDDGVEDVKPITLEARVETVEADTADLKEALEMILNGVTE